MNRCVYCGHPLRHNRGVACHAHRDLTQRSYDRLPLDPHFAALVVPTTIAEATLPARTRDKLGRWT